MIAQTVRSNMHMLGGSSIMKQGGDHNNQCVGIINHVRVCGERTGAIM